MTLQDHLKEKINDFGGIQHFKYKCRELKYRLRCTKEVRIVDNMILYYSTLFIMDVNVEKDVIDNQDMMQDMNTLFSRIEADCCCGFAGWYLDIVKFKTNYVYGLRSLTA